MPKWWANRTAASRYTRHWVRRHGFKIVPTDKDGGFALIPLTLLREMLLEKLQAPTYRETSFLNINEDFIMYGFAKWLKKWAADRNEPGLAEHLCWRMRSAEKSRLTSRLMFTAKTHK